MLDMTVIILTKNEELNIRKCIESFNGIAKRFVIIDSFSDDNTKTICEQLKETYNLDFYQRRFINHADQFNWALDYVDIDTEWIMRIDADEELTSELVQELRERIPKLVNQNISGILLNRRMYFMGKWIKHGGLYPAKILRVFRRGKARCEQKLMDEHIVLSEGQATNFKYDFLDYNTKDLSWWINKHNWYSDREVIDYFNNKNNIEKEQEVEQNLWSGQTERKRWFKNGLYYKLPLFRRANWYFLYRYFIRMGFLDGKEGFIYHFLQAYWYRFLVDSKIHEKNSKDKSFK